MKFQVIKHTQNAISEKEIGTLYQKQVLALLSQEVSGEGI